jgi:hypothetical protein
MDMLLISMLAPAGTREGAGGAYGPGKGDPRHPQHSGGRLGHRLLLCCGPQGECVQHDQQVSSRKSALADKGKLCSMVNR